MINSYLINKVDYNGYESIVTLLDYKTKISNYIKSIKIFPRKKDKILIDTALCSGLNEYRFIEASLNLDGTIDTELYKYVSVNDEVLSFANNVLKTNKKYLNNSILTDNQIKSIL